MREVIWRILATWKAFIYKNILDTRLALKIMRPGIKPYFTVIFPYNVIG